MILKDGSVKVADFGIARVASAQNTLTKEALGSVHYISPEQARGARVDNRSDIYSLGVVMYEMLTGRPPYDGETPVSVAIQHINGTPLSPSLLNSDIPTGLEQITMHAMCSDLNIRYSSVSDMLKDMEEFRKNPTIRFTFLPKGSVSTQSGNPRIQPANQPNPARQKELEREYERQDREERRRRLWMIAAISLAVVALIGLLFLLLGNSGSETPTESSTNSTTTAPSEVEVPMLIGSMYDEIPPDTYPFIKLIADEKSYVYNDKYPVGVIVDQTPSAREMVAPGTKVYVTISLGEQTDTMPPLRGYTAENANILLKALQIKLTILTDREYSDEIEEGRVTRTDPEENSELKNGQVVTVFISMGKETKYQKTPNVVGASQANAVASINGKNLEVLIKEEYSSTVSEGYVISQSPDPGTELEEGSTVTVVVSKGKQSVTLSSVVGETESDAIEKIKALGLNAKSDSEYSETVEAGRVIRQDPAANEELMPGSTVKIVVSLGPTPPPPTSESTEPSSEPTEPSSSEEPSSEPEENP